MNSGNIAIGSTIADSFTVKALLGSGGAGTVYLADDTSLNRQVAIKLLKLSHVDEVSMQQRFDREAKALSQLLHPGIVRVFRYGCLDDNSPYLVMEYVEGESLRSFIEKKGPMQCKDAVAVAMQISAALEFAHSSHIVHRDLKPENIMITQSESGLTAKILDFGLCKTEPVGGAAEATLTGTGFLLGTAQYMSPEQCLGEPVDSRSDIYSFGCVLFEMITGKPPFVSDSIPNILLNHVSTPLPLILELSPRCGLPEELQTLMLKCAAKNKNERYQSFAEVLNDLAQLQKLNSTARFVPQGVRAAGVLPKVAIQIAGILLCFALVSSAFFLIATDRGNAMLATQLQASLPADSAIDSLNSLTQTLLKSGRTSSAILVANESTTSALFAKWPFSYRKRLQQDYIDVFSKAGYSDEVLDLKLRLLDDVLDNFSKSEEGGRHKRDDDGYKLSEDLCKSLLQTKDFREWSKISVAIEKRGTGFKGNRKRIMIWPSILRIEGWRRQMKRFGEERYHDFAMECYGIERVAASFGEWQLMDKYYKEGLSISKQHNFYLIETRLHIMRGLVYAEQGDMKLAQEELKASEASSSGHGLLLSSGDTGQQLHLRKCCEFNRWIPLSEYKTMIPKEKRADNPLLNFIGE